MTHTQTPTLSHSDKIFIEALARFNNMEHGQGNFMSAEEYLNWIGAYYGIKKQCKSPIEEIIAGLSLLISTDNLPGISRSIKCNFECQKNIGKYIVDFLWTVENPKDCIKHLVIECDGHEFHEKTKAQAAHDKKRDRWLTNNGYPILRFTGSEIWNEHDNCMMDIVDGLMAV